MDTKELPRSSTVSDFAGRHSLSLSSAYRLIRSKQIRAFKVNNTTRIAETDELTWLASSFATEQGESV